MSEADARVLPSTWIIRTPARREIRQDIPERYPKEAFGLRASSLSEPAPSSLRILVSSE